MQKLSSKRGFTIIEVVLVLAIAGLIFMMVFIALPSLQRSQRDTQRREDMSRFISQVQQYQANNRNKVPQDDAGWKSFVYQYMLASGSDNFSDPNQDPTSDVNNWSASQSSGTYFVDDQGDVKNATTSGTSDLTFGNYTIYVYHGAECDGEHAIEANSAGTNKIAIRYKLEGAGTYCLTN